MPKPNPILSAFIDERNSALLYQTLSEIEKDPRIAEVYQRISRTELDHAEKWQERAREAGIPLPEYKPGWRVRTLIRLARKIGPQAILPTIQNMENTGTQAYAAMENAMGMASQEQSHSRLLSQITGG